MQYALVNGLKKEAFSKGTGICELCGSRAIAKCGPRILHHWAHEKKKDCDPWWENETLWHREWKSRFPLEYREVTHFDEIGEIHRADVKSPTGIVVEFQHSSMTDEERVSRERFYKNLVWVIDGRGFKDNFDIFHMLPNPESELAQDIVWSKAKRHMHGSNTGLFFRLSEAKIEYPDVTKSTLRGGFYHSIQEIKEEVNILYNGYHQYDWVRPRKTWLDAKCPVYIDFGDEYLVKLDVYDSSGLGCIRLVSKMKFIHDVMNSEIASEIAKRFYPISS